MKHFLRRCLLPLLFVLAITISSHASTPRSVTVAISARVIGDTSNKSIREVLALWTNYLNSVVSEHENTLNPYWSQQEQHEFHTFDLSGSMLYGSIGPGFFQQWKPLILSIDSTINGYVIRTAYIDSDTDDFYQSLFGVQDVMARHVSGQWKLFNPLPYEATKLCKQEQIGRFTFFYTQSHPFNKALARKTIAFADSLSKEFSLPLRSQYQYYVADNVDEITEVMGMPFCLSMSTGITEPEDGRIFTASGLEYYPHELTHLIFGPGVTSFADEGIATLEGGVNYKTGTLQNSVLLEHAELEETSQWPLDSVISSENHFRSTFLFYTVGGMVAALIQHEAGAKGLLTFRAATQLNLIPTIEQLLHTTNLTVGTIWQRYALLYPNSNEAKH